MIAKSSSTHQVTPSQKGRFKVDSSEGNLSYLHSWLVDPSHSGIKVYCSNGKTNYLHSPPDQSIHHTVESKLIVLTVKQMISTPHLTSRFITQWNQSWLFYRYNKWSPLLTWPVDSSHNGIKVDCSKGKTNDLYSSPDQSLHHIVESKSAVLKVKPSMKKECEC